jgi:hypothetical protein
VAATYEITQRSFSALYHFFPSRSRHFGCGYWLRIRGHIAPGAFGPSELDILRQQQLDQQWTERYAELAVYECNVGDDHGNCGWHVTYGGERLADIRQRE